MIVGIPYYPSVPLYALPLGPLSNYALMASMSVALFASIYRYERIAMVLRGTTRYRILQGLRITTLILVPLVSISYTVMVFSAALSSGSAFSEIAYSVYAFNTTVTAAWFMIVDLVLGIRMTFIVIASVRKDKISISLKPKLYGIVAFILMLDLMAITMIEIGGFDAGIYAIFLTLLHSLTSLQLLVVLQKGVRAKNGKPSTVAESSSGRVVSGKNEKTLDSVLVASDQKTPEAKSVI